MYNEKSDYALNYAADAKTLRAEFQNAIAPALNKALAELAVRHQAVETAEEEPRRFCSAFDQVKELAEVGMRRALTKGK